jgi:hypothetical protein
MNAGIERILFTSFIGFLIIAALWVAKDWPIRASIIILLLGGIGAILAIVQLTLDIKAVRGKDAKVARPTFDTQAIEHEGRWGSLEIWAWLWGLFLAIHLIGFPIALPLFVFVYIKLYGGGWPTPVILTPGTRGFLYGIFEKILHVPWPEPLLKILF